MVFRACVDLEKAVSRESASPLPPASARQPRTAQPKTEIAARAAEFAVIDDAAASARVLADPRQERVLGRIAAGTKVKILEKKSIKSGQIAVCYYRIQFDGRDGWISQYVTEDPPKGLPKGC
jgi:hypothetical protein